MKVCTETDDGSFAVSFTTIPPRFDICYKTIQSLLDQNMKPKFIIISVSPYWDPERRIRDHSWQSLLEVRISNSDILRKSLSVKFYEEWKAGIISVIEIPKDYGSASKLVGVLLSFYIYKADYWIICDDDLVYRSNLIQRYYDAYETEKIKPIHGPVITMFDSMHDMFSVRVFGHSVLITQLQGADTYVIPTSVLHRHSMQALPLSYAKFPMFLEHMFQTCPESYFNDDFLISFTVHLSKLMLRSLWNGRTSFVRNDYNDSSEMHLNVLNGFRRNATIHCLKREVGNIAKLWVLKRGRA